MRRRDECPHGVPADRILVSHAGVVLDHVPHVDVLGHVGKRKTFWKLEVVPVLVESAPQGGRVKCKDERLASGP